MSLWKEIKEEDDPVTLGWLMFTLPFILPFYLVGLIVKRVLK